jgi:spore coat protein U-like protein
MSYESEFHAMRLDSRQPSRLSLGLALLLTGLCLNSTPAFAACAFSISAAATAITLSDLNPSPPVGIDVQLVSSAPTDTCDFSVVFSRGAAADYSRYLSKSGDRYSFNLFKLNSASSTILKDRSDATSLYDVTDGVFPVGSAPSTRSVVFYPRISPLTALTLVPPGTYAETIEARLFAGRPPSMADSESGHLTFTFRYDVPKITAMAFDGLTPAISGGAAGARTMDFGDLSGGGNKTVNLTLLFNAGYRLSFLSVNGQRLKHESRDFHIPYQLRVDNYSVDISSGALTQVATGSGITANGGVRTIPVNVQIAPVTNALSGQYNDRIEIVLQSLE